MTGEANSSVVLTELYGGRLGECTISNSYQGVGYSLALQILLQIFVKTPVMFSPLP